MCLYKSKENTPAVWLRLHPGRKCIYLKIIFHKGKERDEFPQQY